MDCIFKNSESSILSFTSDGQFSGYIGHRGNGPGEYTSVYDVVVNQKSKVLEVLSDGGIFCYTFGGDFLDKKEVTYPAFSFAIDDRQNYWFYVGNNTTYGDAKMIVQMKISPMWHIIFIKSLICFRW